jgi:glycosyltransferase involved in cell wall biosynthesis
MKRVLMVAFHFPPLAGSSGIQRTLRFVQHLPAFGWEPIVLTADPRAYERTSEDLIGEVPSGVYVERAFALDAARHLSVGGRYPMFVARPDRWMSWRFAAIPAGLRLIRKYQPQVIWSTFPIATAHAIGDALHRRSQLPWIADFRDPMAQEGYPEDPRIWRSFEQIEQRAVRGARFSVFTAPGAERAYRERYPDVADRIKLIENGYDEEDFIDLPSPDTPRASLNPGALTLLHSGIVYPSERDPSHFFAAMAGMVSRGKLSPGKLKVRFRASGYDEVLATMAQKHRLEDYIELLPPIPYRAALEEMARADGLLILQAANCNQQIPAKLYEYLRIARPILALTDPDGDTAGALREAGITAIARLDSPNDIAELVACFIAAEIDNQRRIPNADYVARASRRERAGALSELLNQAAFVP